MKITLTLLNVIPNDGGIRRPEIDLTPDNLCTKCLLSESFINKIEASYTSEIRETQRMLCCATMPLNQNRKASERAGLETRLIFFAHYFTSLKIQTISNAQVYEKIESTTQVIHLRDRYQKLNSPGVENR